MISPARRFGLEPREWGVFAWGAASLFFAGAAHVSIKNVSEAMFVKRVGVEAIPLVFLANSVLLVATTYGLGRLAGRVQPVRLFRASLVVLGIALLPLWWAVRSGFDAGFPLLLMASKQIEALSLISFWVALGALLHARQAKRLFAPLMAGGTLGTIAGSFASEPLARWLGVVDVLPLAALLLCVAALLARPLRGLLPTRLERATPLERRVKATAREDPASRSISLRELWSESWLFRALAVCSVSAGLLGPMLYYQFSFVADQATSGSAGEQRLLSLYAWVRGWLHMAVLLAQLLVAPRLYRWIGVPLATVMSPLLYLGGFLGLTVRLSLPAGVGALTGTTVQDHAVYDPAQRILFNLFPERSRGRVTALIDGTFKRLGNVGGNLLVLGALELGGALWVGYGGLPIALLWLATAIALWRGYPSLLLGVVSQERSGPNADAVADALDANTARVLARHLADAEPERRRAAVALVCEGRPDVAAEVLAHAARRAPLGPREELIAALDAELDEVRPGSEATRGALDDVSALLAEPEAEAGHERARLVRVLGRLAQRVGAGAEIEPTLRACSEENDPAVRLAAAAALARNGLLQAEEASLDDHLRGAADAADANLRAITRAELGSLLRRSAPPSGREGGVARAVWERRLGLLIDMLERPEDRTAVLEALARLAEVHGDALLPAAKPALVYRDTADPAARAALLRLAGRVGLRDEARWMVESLAGTPPAVRGAALDGLRALGPGSVDALLLEACFGRVSTRTAIASLLTDMQVEGDTLQDLFENELGSIRMTVLRLAALHEGSIAEIVLQRLQERVEENVHTALLLLSVLHHEARIAELGEHWMRVRSVRERVVLLEALEALLNADERSRLLPLIDDRALRARAAAAARALGRSVPTHEGAIQETLEDADPIARALLAATLRSGEDDPGRDPEEGMLSDVEIVLHLKSLPIFERLTTRQLTDLAGVVRQEKHPADAVLVREGEFGDALYLIVEGRVAISKGGHPVRDLGPREFFGEMAMFDGSERSATGTAREAVHLLRIERHDLSRLMEELPGIAIAICQTLSQRLREMTERMQT